MKNNLNSEKQTSEFKRVHLREVLEKSLYHWKWFVLGLIICVSLAFVYLRYTSPLYRVESTVLINDKENESISSEISAFKDLGLVDNNNSVFDTEIGILKSRNLMDDVVKKLGLNKIYYAEGRLHNSELYGSKLPFKLNFFATDSLLYQTDTLISIIPKSQTKFDLLNAKSQKIGTYSFGENVKSKIANFTVTPTTTFPIKVGLKIIFILKPIATITDAYRKNMLIEPLDSKSSLIKISLEDQSKEKAENIISVLVEQYNSEAILDKTLIAENTEEFINERIAGISKELSILDTDTEDFKTSNNLTDIDSESRLILDSNSSLEKETLDLNTQLKLVEYMSNHINKKENELIPTNLGLSNISLNQSTILYNEILLERNRLLQSSNSLNPVIINLENQLLNLKTSISQSLSNLESSLSISLNDLRRQEYKLNSKITSVPKQERELKDIQRRQQIVETLYLYLLEKREENAIALAIKAPNAKIIDKAYGTDVPVAPRKVLVLVSSFLLGFLIPASLIFIKSIFDNKVHTLEDIEAKISAPILGDIPKTKRFNKLLFKADDQSAFMEALRIIRTNIFFVLSKNEKPTKTLFVTSTLKGEGKTSTSISLAKTLALSTKKVLLIGGDIRNPQLANILKIDKKEGLTHFLADSTIKPESLIEHNSVLNIDVLHGGVLAPNPAELLINGRFDALLTYANSKYDYIVVDTAPINMVTDTVLLSQNRADLLIYVIRANYLDKRMLKVPAKMNASDRHNNMAVILNCSNPDLVNGYGYGKGYGYGYTMDNKPWWKIA